MFLYYLFLISFINLYLSLYFFFSSYVLFFFSVSCVPFFLFFLLDFYLYIFLLLFFRYLFICLFIYSLLSVLSFWLYDHHRAALRMSAGLFGHRNFAECLLVPPVCCIGAKHQFVLTHWFVPRVAINYRLKSRLRVPFGHRPFIKQGWANCYTLQDASTYSSVHNNLPDKKIEMTAGC